MTKTGLQLLPPTTPEYIGSTDITFAGSRNGLSSLIWWTHISDHNYESQVEKVLTCLNLVKYAYNELQKGQTDIGKDIWISYTPLTLTLQMMQPSDDLVHKYSLSGKSFTLAKNCIPMCTFT